METNLAQILLQEKAFQINTEKPFKWASGKLMPYYCDNRLLLSSPEARKKIVNKFLEKIAALPTKPDCIVGVATAGIPWGAIIADRLDLNFSYVRAKPKEHGLKKLIEGNLVPGQKVVLIEDLISTGKSSIEAAEVLRDHGVKVMQVLSIFSYDLPEAVENFNTHGFLYDSLLNLNQLLQQQKHHA